MSEPTGQPATTDGPGPDVVEALRQLIAGFLPTQRWFAGKGRAADITVTRLLQLLPSPQVTIWLARVDYGHGEVETYQVPVVSRGEARAELEHVLIGTIETSAGPRWVYDALHDKDVTSAWLAGIRDAPEPGATDSGATDSGAVDSGAVDSGAVEPSPTDAVPSGPDVRFTRFAEADDIPVDEPSLVLSGEQSNTSMIFGDIAIMKVFRRLQPGVNPDIEVQGELSRLGSQNIARLFGAVEADVDGAPTSLAMLQEFLTGATDGWQLSTVSVRDLMAEGDLHADEAGGDFAGESERLGGAVAQIHAELATAFGTREASAEELRTRSALMRDRLHAALEIVPELADVAEGLERIYAEVAELGEAVTVQRIHGDLHLGQALRSITRWVLIDFEGEPMAAIEARRAFDSTLRDVAGMLRSFEYAGHHRVVEFSADGQLAYRAAEWSARNRNAFLDGYAETAGADPRTHKVLLRAFEADKAVYEAIYEARNRPSWLPIPLVSLTRLATDGGAV